MFSGLRFELRTAVSVTILILRDLRPRISGYKYTIFVGRLFAAPIFTKITKILEEIPCTEFYPNGIKLWEKGKK